VVLETEQLLPPAVVVGGAQCFYSSRTTSASLFVGGDCHRDAVPAQGVRSDVGRLAMHKKGDRIVESPVEARAGFLDRPVLVVLTVSTVAVIGLFALVYAAFFSS
jgi:hypothetical protein